MKAYKITYGKKAKHTYFGLQSCYHGIYTSGGYNYYVYGIKNIINLTITETWGDMKNIFMQNKKEMQELVRL